VIWLGFHVRNSVEQGEKLGSDVADWDFSGSSSQSIRNPGSRARTTRVTC